MSNPRIPIKFDIYRGEQYLRSESFAEPIVKIASPAPAGSLRIRLPASVKPGSYCLRALNLHGVDVAQSAAFHVA